jgi:hypothetical protein
VFSKFVSKAPAKGVMMKLSLAGQSFEAAVPSVTAPKLKMKL